MFLIVTRSFPPDIGGMQNLIWGLTNELSKHYMLKVFADFQEKSKGSKQINKRIKLNKLAFNKKKTFLFILPIQIINPSIMIKNIIGLSK